MKIICFLPWGYPSMERSPEIARWYLKGGCDAIEIAIPPRDAYLDNAFLRDAMGKAYQGWPDPRAYLEAIRAFKSEHTGIELLLMLYEETIREIGPGKLAAFCGELAVSGVIAGDLKDPELLRTLRASGVPLAGRANFTMTDELVEGCLAATGFIYQRAAPTQGQPARSGCETLAGCISHLRRNGVTRPIYCGMGIKTPEDARLAMEAGADGCFVGSSIVRLFDEPQRLIDTITEYRRAVRPCLT